MNDEVLYCVILFLFLVIIIPIIYFVDGQEIDFLFVVLESGSIILLMTLLGIASEMEES